MKSQCLFNKAFVNLTALFFVFIFCSSSKSVYSQEVREYIDLQIHPTMHFSFGFFGKGLEFFDEKNPPKLSYKHQLTNVNYANYWKNNKGIRVFVVGLVIKETIHSEKRAHRLIMEQIAYINKFVSENPNDFIIAKTPSEVRDYIKNTTKTIVVYSIEGGKKLLDKPGDAEFWAKQGVSFVTLVHLRDYNNGGAGIRPGFATTILNLKGYFKKQRKRGLTEKGKNTILALARAGVMTDITHMSDQTREDALNFMESKGIPPIATHDFFKPIQNGPRGISEKHILQIYRNNGLMSLPISAISLMPHKPVAKYKAILDTMKCFCNGSIDSYKFTYLALQKFVEQNVPSLLGNPNKTYNSLSESEKVNFSIGFQTDFNGWANHHRPRYGKQGCYPVVAGKTYEDIELQGMPHPGLLESHWKLLEKEGVDLSPVKRSSEKFLQLWQYFIDHKNQF